MDAFRVDSARLHLVMLAGGKGNGKSKKSKMHHRITLQVYLPPNIQFWQQSLGNNSHPVKGMETGQPISISWSIGKKQKIKSITKQNDFWGVWSWVRRLALKDKALLPRHTAKNNGRGFPGNRQWCKVFCIAWSIQDFMQRGNTTDMALGIHPSFQSISAKSASLFSIQQWCIR